jgi:hypothetical protein
VLSFVMRTGLEHIASGNFGTSKEAGSFKHAQTIIVVDETVHNLSESRQIRSMFNYELFETLAILEHRLGFGTQQNFESPLAVLEKFVKSIILHRRH